jgi:hypothetical protein
MPELPDIAFNHLKKLVGDVSFRAGRLREWIALGRSLRALSGSFTPFNSDVKVGAQNPATMNVARLSETWRNVEDNPFVELEGFRAPTGMRYINRALVANGQGDADPTVAQWIDQFLDIGGQIRSSLDGLQIGDLATHCTKFDAHLLVVIRRHRASVDAETDQLFFIASTLHTRLDA